MKIIIDLFPQEQAVYDLNINDPVANVSIEGDPYGPAASIQIRLHPDDTKPFTLNDGECGKINDIKKEIFGFLTVQHSWQYFFKRPDASRFCRDMYRKLMFQPQYALPGALELKSPFERRASMNGRPPNTAPYIGPRGNAAINATARFATRTARRAITSPYVKGIAASAAGILLLSYITANDAVTPSRAEVETGSTLQASAHSFDTRTIKALFGSQAADMELPPRRPETPDGEHMPMAGTLKTHGYDCDLSLNTPGQNVYLRITRCLQLAPSK